MVKKLFLTTMIIAVGIIVCNASEIDGKWKTSFADMELIFTFKVDGENLTGTVSTDMGEMEIKNGKVNGNDFTFDIDMGMGDPMPHKCKLDGDIIKINVEMGEMGGGGPQEMILKKVE